MNKEEIKNCIQLRIVEKRLGVKFPKDYVECVIENQGGTPSKRNLMVDGLG